MEVVPTYISASSNPTYNSILLTDDEGQLLFAANKALGIYDLQEEKVISTRAEHSGRINCLRFVKNGPTSNTSDLLLSCCSGGSLILWKRVDEDKESYVKIKDVLKCPEACFTVCAGIELDNDDKGGGLVIGCISTDSKVTLYKTTRDPDEMVGPVQEIQLNKGLANELVFHTFDQDHIVMALGKDTGSVDIYDLDNNDKLQFNKIISLNKHEDWVRCMDFYSSENGDILLASGGQDSFIALWRFTKSKMALSRFEFQVHKYRDYSIIFDSMIIGHEGWINSLQWNLQGELLSCSNDQSIILWENMGELWVEKSRFGAIGGMIPGGCCARMCGSTVATSGFQGAVQIWRQTPDEEWEVRPSITGHFRPISDMDYDPQGGNFIVTTSQDQTTRVHAPWGDPEDRSRWHEISRPQIHGHDLFACRALPEGNMIVSGAEEKMLRAFQPTSVFYKNFEDSTHIRLHQDKTNEAAKAAFLPALGLSNSNQGSDSDDLNSHILNFQESPLTFRLDEDSLRSHTLWLEVSKLYGHVYEIACLATSPKDPLIASASQATQQKFASIILWCSRRWKNLGEFPHHKLNVTGMEFTKDGGKLLSVSRDRTWVVWKVFKGPQTEDFQIEVLHTGGVHTRALWVGTWSPLSNPYFVTGARDKKLIIWENKDDDKGYEVSLTQTFTLPVSAASVNSEDVVAVGLESGEIKVFKYVREGKRLKKVGELNQSEAHHATVKRLMFNPSRPNELASIGEDGILKVFEIRIVNKT